MQGALRTVALDGKTLRGSFDHLTDRKAVHVLSAFASDAALILAHQELSGAPDEIAAVPKLMAELGLTGVLFTADALHCQKDGFAQAAATGNALLVRVKDNQPTLHATLAGLCATERPFDSYETVDRGRRGRLRRPSLVCRAGACVGHRWHGAGEPVLPLSLVLVPEIRPRRTIRFRAERYPGVRRQGKPIRRRHQEPSHPA